MRTENMTLEERERLAYITNSPDHALIVLALAGDEDARAQIEELESQVSNHDDEVTKLKGELEDKDTELEDKDTELATVQESLEEAKATINKLTAKLAEGMQAKQVKPRRARKEGVADLL